MTFEDAILKLSPEEGDIIFFDLGAVDTESLKKLCTDPPEGLSGVTFIGISLRHGQSVEDTVFSMTKPELEMLTSDKKANE